MHEIAVTTLAAGGKGGGTKLAIFVVLLIVIVILAIGWIKCAAGARAARADGATPPREDPPGENR